MHIHWAQALTLARTSTAAAIVNTEDGPVVLTGNLVIGVECILPGRAHGAITVWAVGAKGSWYRVAEDHKAQKIAACAELYIFGATVL